MTSRTIPRKTDPKEPASGNRGQSKQQGGNLATGIQIHHNPELKALDYIKENKRAEGTILDYIKEN